MDDSKEIMCSRHNRTDEHMNSQRLKKACTEPVQVQAKMGFQPWERKLNMGYLSKTKSCNYNWSLVAERKWVFSMVVSYLIRCTSYIHFRAGPMPRSSWLTQNEFHGFTIDISSCLSLAFCFDFFVLYKQRGEGGKIGGRVGEREKER